MSHEGRMPFLPPNQQRQSTEGTLLLLLLLSNRNDTCNRKQRSLLLMCEKIRKTESKNGRRTFVISSPADLLAACGMEFLTASSVAGCADSRLSPRSRLCTFIVSAARIINDPCDVSSEFACKCTQAHTCLTALFPGLPG